jgi:hypothetical protein
MKKEWPNRDKRDKPSSVDIEPQHSPKKVGAAAALKYCDRTSEKYQEY